MVGGVAQSALAFLVPPALAMKGAQEWGECRVPSCGFSSLTASNAVARNVVMVNALQSLFIYVTC